MLVEWRVVKHLWDAFWGDNEVLPSFDLYQLGVCILLFGVNNLMLFIHSGIPGRPRKLKVVINPRSKKGQARLVYLKQVAPLFEKAGIRADLMSELKGSFSINL